jgi:hypothetical protein
MAQLTNYRALVKQALTDYAMLLKNPPEPDYEVVLAFDDEHRQYILRRLGWKPDRRIQYTDLHVAIRNGTIWIEEDWTEDGIATYFLEQGVPNQNIVLAFQPPQIRPLTEFAVA